MKIDVGPLLDAIDRYIAKADSDLEENLSAEGYVGAAKAVQLAGELELELQSCHVVAGNWTQDLWNSSQCS